MARRNEYYADLARLGPRSEKGLQFDDVLFDIIEGNINVIDYFYFKRIQMEEKIDMFVILSSIEMFSLVNNYKNWSYVESLSGHTGASSSTSKFFFKSFDDALLFLKDLDDSSLFTKLAIDQKHSEPLQDFKGRWNVSYLYDRSCLLGQQDVCLLECVFMVMLVQYLQGRDYCKEYGRFFLQFVEILGSDYFDVELVDYYLLPIVGLNLYDLSKELGEIYNSN